MQDDGGKMMTLRERENAIVALIYCHSEMTAKDIRDTVGRHLRKVVEDMGKCLGCGEIYGRGELHRCDYTCLKKETAAQQNEREKVHAYYDRPGGCICDCKDLLGRRYNT